MLQPQAVLQSERRGSQFEELSVMFKTERGCDREGMDERFFECGVARDRCATGRQCRSSLLRSMSRRRPALVLGPAAPIHWEQRRSSGPVSTCQCEPDHPYRRCSRLRVQRSGRRYIFTAPRPPSITMLHLQAAQILRRRTANSSTPLMSG